MSLQSALLDALLALSGVSPVLGELAAGWSATALAGLSSAWTWPSGKLASAGAYGDDGTPETKRRRSEAKAWV